MSVAPGSTEVNASCVPAGPFDGTTSPSAGNVTAAAKTASGLDTIPIVPPVCHATRLTSSTQTGSSITVLVLDKMPGARQVLGDLLQRYGFASLQADSVADGLDSVDGNRLDAVVVGSGFSAQRVDVLESLRHHPRHRFVPVFVVVDEAERDNADAALLRHYSAYVFYATQSYDVLMKYLCRVVSRTNLV